MVEFRDVIMDAETLGKRYIVRDGMVFTSITHPANIYDAIVVKYPPDIPCTSPNMHGSICSLEEQLEFIRVHKIEKALIIADSIGFIMSCPSLKYFRIIPADSADRGFDYSPLYGMPQIKSLQAKAIYGRGEKFTTELDCAKLRGLEKLSVTNRQYKHFNAVQTLKSLGLSNYRGKDLTAAFSSSILDTLTVLQSGIESLDGIQTSQRLQCLYLYHNRTLRDIGAIRDVKSTLRALRIENCPRIDDFSVLSELENLELLELSGNNELPDLEFLRKMKSLKTFVFTVNVKSGDLSPCMNLSYAYSGRNRRHYDRKDADLPKGQYVRGNETIEDWRRME